MRRFNIGIHHKDGIGIPGTMVEHPQGQYVLHADVVELERQLEAVGAGGVSLINGPALPTDEDINSAAMVLAECMDYPWGNMPEQGRESMRSHARSIIAVLQRHTVEEVK